MAPYLCLIPDQADEKSQIHERYSTKKYNTIALLQTRSTFACVTSGPQRQPTGAAMTLANRKAGEDKLDLISS